MKIKVNYGKEVGKMRPMHAVCQPPMLQLNGFMLHYLTEAGIPYSRLHDVGGFQGGNLYVDVPNLFRDFDADENDPASYDFTFTDSLLSQLAEHKVEPLFRLGVTIENYRHVKAYRIFPPKDFAKWARICEHIIRHYNEGWANGFHHHITYWEIWCEPDDGYFPNSCSSLWKGTPQQFFEMYTITAKHLKACFGDSIQVGGYGSCGFYGFEEYCPNCEEITHPPRTPKEGYEKFAQEFLVHIKKENAPMDFFSWHCYSDVAFTLKASKHCRQLLEKYGYGDVPDFLDEWNICHTAKSRSTDMAAAKSLGMMLTMQTQSTTAMLNFYDARIATSQYGGLFNPDTWEPYLAYFAFKLFNDAFVLKNQVQSESEDESVVPVCAAANEKRKVLLAANMSDKPVDLEFELLGADPADAEVIMTNCEYKNTLTGKQITGNTFKIPAYTCLELRF
ncbi:MAG: hypothetical protein IJJ26_09355 [Victivallales bacterium]|nr:hypothetical protein [Victivallales bacterium]